MGGSQRVQRVQKAHSQWRVSLNHGGDQRVQRGKFFYSRQNAQGQSQKFHWRSNLFSVFVDNLSCRVSKNALWEAFCQYGKVVDVYISFASKYGKARSYTFAFVRYKFEHEALAAIEEGNRRMIDGRCIVVKKAESDASSKSKLESLEKAKNTDQVYTAGKVFSDVVRDGISYREVLLGKELFVDKVCKPDLGSKDDVVSLSAVGKLLNVPSIAVVQEIFDKNNVNAVISPLGGISVLVTFHSKQEMKGFCSDKRAVATDSLDHIALWNFSDVQRQVAVWVNLEEVPLLVWHDDFFKSLGNSWGKVMKVDACTSQRKRFDIAKLFILVESRLNVPSSVTINLRGKDFKILVSIEDSHWDQSTVIDEFSGETQGSPSDPSRDAVAASPGSANIQIGRQSGYVTDLVPWELPNQLEVVPDKRTCLLEKEMSGGSVKSVRVSGSKFSSVEVKGATHYSSGSEDIEAVGLVCPLPKPTKDLGNRELALVGETKECEEYCFVFKC
ncbi:hypothetical protein REPUB_Repub19eG0049700 [Reevesia pubescens]